MLSNILNLLYKHGINTKIEAIYDFGWVCMAGDALDGWKKSPILRSIYDADAWFRDIARELEIPEAEIERCDR